MNAQNPRPVKKNNKNLDYKRETQLCFNLISPILQEIQGVYYIFTKSIDFQTFICARGFAKAKLFLNSPLRKNHKSLILNILLPQIPNPY
jgi:hypothetical protein